jgi:hypothetical protein
MANTPLSRAELEELKKLYREIEGLDRDRAKSAAEHAASIGRATSELERLRQEYKDMSDDISYAAKGFKSIVQEITNQNIGVKESIKGYNKLSSIAEKIQSYQRGISELSSKDIEKLKEQVKQEKLRLENAQDLLKDKKSSLVVDKTSIDNEIRRLGIEIRRKRVSGDSARAEINQIQKLQKSLEKNAFQQKQIQESLSQNAAIISDQDQLFKGLNVTLDRTLEQTQNLEKALGLGGNAAKGIETTLNNIGLGDLSSKLGLDEVNKKMKETADKITDGGEKTAGFIGKVRVLGAGIGEMGKQLAKNLLDPMVILGFILKGILAVDKAQTEYTRETGHSIDTVDTLNTSLITTADYIKAATELTKQFGVAADAVFTKETLQEATEMVELMGMSNEEAGKLARLSKVSGTELKANNEKIMASYSNFVKLNKSGISAKSVFKDVANVSNTIALSFKGNSEAIAKSVMEARKLGLTLEQVDKVAESLLNFEDSISAELEAELLTGKQINLEQARLYALNNDMVGLTKEIGNNQAIIESFSSGNRIQQEAIAKTMGMSREEMSKMIYDQQITNGLTEEQAAKLADVSLEDMKRLSIQESITKSIEKMSQAFAPLLSFVAEYAEIILSVVGAFVVLNGLMKAQQIIQGVLVGLEISKRSAIVSGNAARAAGNVLAGQELAKQVAIATAWAIANPFKAIAGLAVAAGVGAMIYSSMKKAPGLKDGGTVLGEGAIMVGEEGPEIMTAKPGATVTPLNKTSAAKTGGGREENNTAILNEIKNLLQQIASTPGTITLDGTKVGTVMTPFVNQTNVQTQVKTGANI